jgi:uncharacterized protein
MFFHLEVSMRAVRFLTAFGFVAAVLVSFANESHAQAPANVPAGIACPAQPQPPTQEKMAALAANARDRGFLWRFEKDGRVGHLYGSIHVAKEEWAVPGPRTIAALQMSDTIALELDVMDAQIQQQMSDPSKFGIKSFPMTPAQKQRIEALSLRTCAPVAAIASMHPVMQVTTLSLFDARFAGLEFIYGSEMFLANFGRGMKKSVRSLETPELQMRALMGGDSREMQESIESAITLLESGAQRKQTERMLNAWANSDLKDLQAFESWCECVKTPADRKFLKRVNDDRNPGLAKAIDRLVREGRKVFAAVGALHMAGAKPVPKLLEEMGYKLERIDFSQPVEPVLKDGKAAPKAAAPKTTTEPAQKSAPAKPANK